MPNRIVSAHTMRAMDARTCTVEQITSHMLMARAGQALFDKILTKKQYRNKRPLVVCGPGNNGGDGLVVAEKMLAKGMDVAVFLVSENDVLSDENQQVYERIKSHVIRIQKPGDLAWLDTKVKESDWILEALFGLGLTRSIKGLFANVIKRLNASRKPIVSIDLPAGLHTDSGLVLGCAIQATETWAIQTYKYGHFLGEGQDVCGHLERIEAGIVLVESIWSHQHMTPADFKGKFPLRKQNVHKYHFGHVLVFGGSENMMGAPILTALASMRSGSGLASIVIPETLRPYYTFEQPEIMVRTYPLEDHTQTLSAFNDKAVCVFGPGLGKEISDYAAVISSLIAQKRTLVVDADGLHHAKPLRSQLLASPHVVLTPHYGEFVRFFDVNPKADEDFVTTVERVMQGTQAVLVLKGPVTLIVIDGCARWISFGSSALAKAGTGDVLAGIIAARIAVNPSLFAASCEAVALHAKAGLLVEQLRHRESLIASDLIDVLHDAFHALHNENA